MVDGLVLVDAKAVVSSALGDVCDVAGTELFRKGAVVTVARPVLPDNGLVALSFVFESLLPKGEEID